MSQWSTAYKILKCKNNELYSLMCNSIPEEYIIKYEENKIIYPVKPSKVLYVFKDLEVAREHQIDIDKEHIWECSVLNLNNSSGLMPVSIFEMKSFWQDVESNSDEKYNYRHHTNDTGFYYAEALKLIKRVA